MDMDGGFATKVLELPEDSANPGDSTAAVRDHGNQRMLAAGVTTSGKMVAMVSAQLLEKMHLIDLGSGTSPLEAASSSSISDVDNIPGMLPKMVFVPETEKQVGCRSKCRKIDAL